MATSSDTDDILVRVRAQVMARDDSSGGWLPYGTGGLSWVALKRRALEVAATHTKQQQTQQQPKEQEQRLLEERGESEGDDGGGGNVAEKDGVEGEGKRDCSCQYEYLIIGHRISDNSEVLSCKIKRDFEYNEVMPTFHHWRTGSIKFGLTFQTSVDAVTFGQGVRTALADLLNDGSAERRPEGGGGDGDVFMMLNLPLERDVSSSGTPVNRSPIKSMSPQPPPPSASLSRGASPPYHPHPHLQRGGGGTHPHHHVTSPSSGSPHAPLLPHKSSHHHPPVSQPVSPVGGRLTPTLSSPLHGAGGGGGSESYYYYGLNQQNSQRLTRSRTVCGGSAGAAGGSHHHRYYAGTRGSLRATGLPLGDPPPPGDNIYEWLHASEKLPPDANQSVGDYPGDKYPPGHHPHHPLAGIERDSVSDTYVRFDVKDLLQADHQYQYPNLESLANVLPSHDKNGRRSSLSSLKCHSASIGLEETFTFQSKEKGKKRRGKNKKKGSGMRVRCAHCQELYTESENKRGACSYSPDAVRQGIECVSCLACAKCLLYHCHYEDENFSEEEICTCTDSDGHLTQRWIGLSLLAVLVPCLCLYPVLTACYKCARACHVCGGKHVPV
eukprot:TRINITY_DN12684_c0_g1_i1.p1 TRINITY_DN12684_c0_g1~~TRINITY_DN12684_c0_g1_i1.p1  ORF type:complete len:609 (+),score=124.99 TRINITY_DN12684_c0_g1_i1:315-2141(+)